MGSLSSSWARPASRPRLRGCSSRTTGRGPQGRAPRRGPDARGQAGGIPRVEQGEGEPDRRSADCRRPGGAAQHRGIGGRRHRGVRPGGSRRLGDRIRAVEPALPCPCLLLDHRVRIDRRVRASPGLRRIRRGRRPAIGYSAPSAFAMARSTTTLRWRVPAPVTRPLPGS